MVRCIFLSLFAFHFAAGERVQAARILSPESTQAHVDGFASARLDEDEYDLEALAAEYDNTDSNAGAALEEEPVHVDPVPLQKTASKENCAEFIMGKTQEVMLRVTIFFGQDCGVLESHVSSSTSDTEDLVKALCKPSCLAHEGLQAKPPDFAELEARCSGTAELENARPSFELHEGINAAWQTCPREEVAGGEVAAAIQKDPEDEDVAAVAPPKSPVIAVAGGEVAAAIQKDPEDDDVAAVAPPKSPLIAVAGGEVPTAIQKDPEEDVAAVAPPKSPVIAPVIPRKEPKSKGKRVLQQRMAYRLNNVLADRSAPSCQNLVDVFAMFDYDKTGAIALADIHNILDVLSDDQKSEVVGEFQNLAKSKQSVDFGDFARKKLSFKDTTECMMAYAKRQR